MTSKTLGRQGSAPSRLPPNVAVQFLLAVFIVATLAGFFLYRHLDQTTASTPSRPIAAERAISDFSPLINAFGQDAAKSRKRFTPLDLRSSALRLQKAKSDVERRQKQLDRARRDYLRMGRQLAQESQPDAFAKLARRRVEDAADALDDAKAELEQAHLAFAMAKRQGTQNQMVAAE